MELNSDPSPSLLCALENLINLLSFISSFDNNSNNLVGYV